MASLLLPNRLFLTLVPVLVAVAYPLLKASTVPSTSGPRQHSLAGLPAEVKAQVDEVYPEDIYPGGAYVDLPIGRVSAFPDCGRRVFPMNMTVRCATGYLALKRDEKYFLQCNVSMNSPF